MRLREKIPALFKAARAKRALNWAVFIAAALVLPFVYQAAIEFIRGQSLTGLLEYLWLRRRNLLPGYLIMLSAFLLVAGTFGRPWAANLLMGAATFAGGFANYYKLLYRDGPVIPRDLVQLGEAAQIAGRLETPLTREMVLLLVGVVLTTLALLPFKIPLPGGWKGTLARVLVSVAGFGLCLRLSLGFAEDYDLMEGVTATHAIDALNIDYSTYYFYGSFVSSFFHFLPAYLDSIPAAPEGYGQAAMAELARQLDAPPGGKTPDVIVVLSESFYDLATIEGTSYSEPLTPNFERLAGAGEAGTLLSPVRGGGTAWVEYMLLTGYSSEGVPLGSVPYIEYMRADYPSFPRYFAGQGYQTVAVHPYYATFYSRDDAYAAMGFERFVTIDDFAPIGETGNQNANYVDDAALAERMIAEYEARAAQDAPVFMLGVSMQNHAPYEAGVYDAAYEVKADSGQGAGYDEPLSALATGIRDADAMLGTLADYFESVDRDVVLLFFGDHQVSIAPAGGEGITSLTGAYQSATPDEQWLMLHSTPWLMWGNYAPGPGQAPAYLAPNLLLPVLLQRYGAQAAPWSAWLAQSTGTLAGEVAGYYLLPDGTVTREPDAAMLEVVRTGALFQYDLMFGKGYALEALYG